MMLTKTLLLALGIFAVLAMVLLAFSGPSSTKAFSRRVLKIKARHGLSNSGKAEAALKRAIENHDNSRSRKKGANLLDTIDLRLKQTGKGWTVKQYIWFSIGFAVLSAIGITIYTGIFQLGLLCGVVLAVLLPWMVTGHLIKKRLKTFIVRFPDAIELMVRGLRTGLPITETLSIVSREIPDPVGIEFKTITERMKIGRTMDDALKESATRLDTPEFNFFCVTLAIQKETGGNLAETLSNLATVLRQRAQMKMKIKAMSSESRASAYIVGALPFLVFIAMSVINPEYTGAFFVDPRLIMVGIGGLIWMGLGVFIMFKMSNFEI